MTIRSQAPCGDGSETIESASGDAVSRVHFERSGSARPPLWGEEIVRDSRKREKILKTLVSKISISEQGCWQWQGSTTLGYGNFRLPDVLGIMKIMAHRAAWVAFKGEPIPGGLFVCHHCDNPRCFNPDHLFLGTQKQNLQDCAAKGRTLTGERNNMNKYDDKTIARVRELLASGKNGRQVSEITGVSQTHISRIKKGYDRKPTGDAAGNFVHHNRKYSDEQLQQVAKLLHAGKLDAPSIAKIVGVSKFLVADMRKGKAHKRFMELAAG